MRLNAPAVGNKLFFSLSSPLLFIYFFFCWHSELIAAKNKLTPPVLHRDKPFTMHAGPSQQPVPLCLCKKPTQHPWRIIQFYPLVSSSFFPDSGGTQQILYLACKMELFSPYYWVIKAVGLRCYAFSCTRSGNVTTRSKLHLWASLYIELTFRGCRCVSLPRLLPVGHKSKLFPSCVIMHDPHVWRIHVKQSEGGEHVCRIQRVNDWQLTSGMWSCRDTFLLLFTPHFYCSNDNDWLVHWSVFGGSSKTFNVL